MDIIRCVCKPWGFCGWKLRMSDGLGFDRGRASYAWMSLPRVAGVGMVMSNNSGRLQSFGSSV